MVTVAINTGWAAQCLSAVVGKDDSDTLAKRVVKLDSSTLEGGIVMSETH